MRGSHWYVRALLVPAVVIGLCAGLHAAPPVSLTQTANGWTYTWDGAAELQNETYLLTDIPVVFNGADVAQLIGADTFYNAGTDGDNSITTNIEAGHIWGTANGHETLTHVVSYNNHATAPGAPFGVPAYDRHATWVGMMIGGRRGGAAQGQWQNGIAPQTDLRSGAIATSWVAPAYAGTFNATIASLDFPYSSAVSGFGTADVINSSWGATGTNESAGVDARAMIIDSLANGNRFTTFVASAGNDGDGPNTVCSPGSGYNGITVGALENDGANNYVAIASFSSRGPQAYADPVNGFIPHTVAQRAAVDIAAPGTNLTSAYYGGTTGGNDASLAGSPSGGAGGPNWYTLAVQGTSFSAPITAGGAALMHDAAVDNVLPVDAEDTRVVKANMLNAAAKIPGWSNAQVAHVNGNGGVRTTQALDFASGAGALDLDRTHTQYLTGQTDIAGMNGGSTAEVIGWDYAQVAIGGATDVAITTTLLVDTEFRATLCWFRERFYTDPLNQTDVAFANLDLEIWDSTFTTLYSDSISLYTPVEHLTFMLPVTGKYGVRVLYTGNIFGNISEEEYGLAWWGVEAPDDGGAIPEPAALGLIGMALLVRRRRR